MINVFTYLPDMSIRTVVATSQGPDGELPEALQKLDPRIVEMVCSEILDGKSSVQWDDIAGQDQAKRLVQELVVWPMLNPHLFKVCIHSSPCITCPRHLQQS